VACSASASHASSRSASCNSPHSSVDCASARLASSTRDANVAVRAAAAAPSGAAAALGCCCCCAAARRAFCFGASDGAADGAAAADTVAATTGRLWLDNIVLLPKSQAKASGLGLKKAPTLVRGRRAVGAPLVGQRAEKVEHLRKADELFVQTSASIIGQKFIRSLAARKAMRTACGSNAQPCACSV
jgi:hypothetical protein